MKWFPSKDDGSCIRTNTAGVQYEEFTCLYPTYGKTFFEVEKNYDPVPCRDWMRENSWILLFALACYAAIIVGGKQYFKNRAPWNWRRTMAMWNLSLAVFSFLGLIRMFPILLHNWSTYSWRENFCMDPEQNVGSGSTGLWAQLFVISKFPELFDTFFIVIHKKKLIFLHWYHHISVLMFCWHGYINNPPTGVIFCTMNYGVHAVMYFYYFLMAVGHKPKWFRAHWITLAQISQMVVGVAVTLTGVYLLTVEKPPCFLNFENLLPSMVMYGSYLLLFVQFFLARYTFGVRANAKKKTV